MEAIRREGLSPRGRGNRSGQGSLRRRRGSIPAGAGEPAPRPAPAACQRVYPRGGGGTMCPRRLSRTSPGLSPRGRGNRQDRSPSTSRRGSIPAGAGEPSRRATSAPTTRVYPRGGGGTGHAVIPAHLWRGLSPRGRGNLLHRAGLGMGQGSIPAGAGEPAGAQATGRGIGVYPRGGGGTSPGSYRTRIAPGLSPRGRGNHRDAQGSADRRGSIPAGAGEPGRVRLADAEFGVYPRGGGGTDFWRSSPRYVAGLSPRGRGNRLSRLRVQLLPGSIPAGAGEPDRPHRSSH